MTVSGRPSWRPHVLLAEGERARNIASRAQAWLGSPLSLSVEIACDGASGVHAGEKLAQDGARFAAERNGWLVRPDQAVVLVRIWEVPEGELPPPTPICLDALVAKQVSCTFVDIVLVPHTTVSTAVDGLTDTLRQRLTRRRMNGRVFVLTPLGEGSSHPSDACMDTAASHLLGAILASTARERQAFLLAPETSTGERMVTQVGVQGLILPSAHDLAFAVRRAALREVIERVRMPQISPVAEDDFTAALQTTVATFRAVYDGGVEPAETTQNRARQSLVDGILAHTARATFPEPGSSGLPASRADTLVRTLLDDLRHTTLPIREVTLPPVPWWLAMLQRLGLRAVQAPPPFWDRNGAFQNALAIAVPGVTPFLKLLAGLAPLPPWPAVMERAEGTCTLVVRDFHGDALAVPEIRAAVDTAAEQITRALRELPLRGVLPTLLEQLLDGLPLPDASTLAISGQVLARAFPDQFTTAAREFETVRVMGRLFGNYTSTSYHLVARPGSDIVPRVIRESVSKLTGVDQAPIETSWAMGHDVFLLKMKDVGLELGQT